MKKIALLTSLIVHVNITEPAPIRSTAFGRSITKITNHIAFRVCRKIGYIGTICGISYLVARYLNDYRNSSRTIIMRHTPPSTKEPLDTVTIDTEGLTTIQGRDEAHGVTMRTERLDPDTQSHSLLQQDRPVTHEANRPSRWQRFWRWLLRPSHRAVVRHIISVPRNTNIILHTRSEILHRHKIAHPDNPPIIIDGVDGNIEAHTDSGDIRITNPGGNVTVGTPDRADILNFGSSITLNRCSSLHIVRRQDNEEGVVSIGGHIQPMQAEYQLPRP